jgi:hypothetical protein
MAIGYLADGLVQDTAVLEMSSCHFREFKHQQIKRKRKNCNLIDTVGYMPSKYMVQYTYQDLCYFVICTIMPGFAV